MKEWRKERTSERIYVWMHEFKYACMYVCFGLMPPFVGGYETMIRVWPHLGPWAAFRLGSPSGLSSHGNWPYPPCVSHCTLSSSILTCNFSKGICRWLRFCWLFWSQRLAIFVTTQKSTHIGIAVSDHFKRFTFKTNESKHNNTDTTSGPGMNYHWSCYLRPRIKIWFISVDFSKNYLQRFHLQQSQDAVCWWTVAPLEKHGANIFTKSYQNMELIHLKVDASRCMIFMPGPGPVLQKHVGQVPGGILSAWYGQNAWFLKLLEINLSSKNHLVQIALEPSPAEIITLALREYMTCQRNLLCYFSSPTCHPKDHS